MSAPLPVTVIGGYLGAGKTSLVNHLLRNADGLRLAVLVNEFGALPIDEDLIETQDDNIISIAGGCVCCSYGSNMTAALIELGDLDPAPDHVLLEASGVALPGSIRATVSLLEGFSAQGVVILADAETLRENAQHKYLGDTVTRQLADADIVVLNKADLVSQDELAATQAFIKLHANEAAVLRAEHGRLPRDVVLQSFAGQVHIKEDHHDVGGFKSISVPFERVCDPNAVARLLASENLGLVRAKGFVRASDGSVFAIQCVGRRWAVEPADAGASLGVVCIGLKPGFDAEQLRTAISGVG